ncbi:hypothetical protein S40293_04275 [Stachybotrys chartarum IBT 40293]|nr:hypothetical protein S40293_04275 [Stachybotrys chartarum IBT 40293]
MATLPVGWEWDYDGSRWFYKYKPTGHVQYHFPTEGDEFPVFIDAASPAPVLSPEERLESQHQRRRHVGPSSAADRPQASDNGGLKPQMSASARPVSDIWVDEHADEEGSGAAGAFQPESFMFLGPGTYTDVSPLVDEEDEEEAAAKRAVVGKVEVEATEAKVVSPLSSAKATPQVANSEPVAVHHTVEVEATLAAAVAAVAPSPPQPESPEVHMLDSREMPHELSAEGPRRRFDPVGTLPEMPTEHTGRAYIERHPPAVEIGDNTVLAPIETAVATGIAELPGQSSPVMKEKKEMEKEKEKGKEKVKQSEGRKTVSPQTQQRAGDETGEKKDKGEKVDDKYEPYSPSHAPAENTQARVETTRTNSEVRTPLQREGSLLMGAGLSILPTQPSSAVSQSQSLPTDDPIPGPLRIAKGKAVENKATSATSDNNESEQGLTYMPSVLKPGRSGHRRSGSQEDLAQEAAVLSEFGTTHQQDEQSGVSKFPSVLRPARGRTTSQPGHPQNPASPQPGSPLVQEQSAEFQAEQRDQIIQDATGPVAVKEQEVTKSTTTVAVASHRPAVARAATETNLAEHSAAIPAQRNVGGGSQPVPPPTKEGSPSKPRGPGDHVPRTNSESLIRQLSRRHSSFSPSDISPVNSRSGSQSSEVPVFTPSPVTQTPTAQSTQSSVQTPQSVRATPPVTGPSEPCMTPLEPDQGSYFAGQADPGPSAQTQSTAPLRRSSQGSRRHSVPAPQPLYPVEEPGSTGIKIIDVTLNRIQEDDEVAAALRQKRGHARSISDVSSIHSSPRLQTSSIQQSPVSQARVPHSAGVPGSAGHLQQQQWPLPPHQHTQHLHLQQQHARQQHGPRLVQLNTTPQSQGPGYGHFPPHGPTPPQGIPAAPGFGPAGPWQPQHSGRNPPISPPVQPGASSGSTPTQAAAMSPVGKGKEKEKEKEKKWTKWFKVSKPEPQSTTPQLAQYNPPAPAMGQAPRSVLQKQPPPSWGGGEYAQPAVWQPGQPVRGHAQPPVHSPAGPFQPVSQGAVPTSLAAPQQDEVELSGARPANKIRRKPPVHPHTSQQSSDQAHVASPHPPVCPGNALGPNLGPTQHVGGPAQIPGDALAQGQPPYRRADQLASAGLNTASRPLAPSQPPPQAQENWPLRGSGRPGHGRGAAAVNTQIDLARRPTQQRWANSPATDYSGGDWGNDEHWR